MRTLVLSTLNGSHRREKGRGFSLIELVIVVVIIGIIGAIAVPRMSRGSVAAQEAAVRQNLNIMRDAIERYYAEHGVYPMDGGRTVGQLIGYTDDQGDAQKAADATHIYGPYLYEIPAIPIGPNKGSQVLADDPSDKNAAWIYNSDTGAIYANVDGTDSRGFPWKSY